MGRARSRIAHEQSKARLIRVPVGVHIDYRHRRPGSAPFVAEAEAAGCGEPLGQYAVAYLQRQRDGGTIVGDLSVNDGAAALDGTSLDVLGTVLPI